MIKKFLIANTILSGYTLLVWNILIYSDKNKKITFYDVKQTLDIVK